MFNGKFTITLITMFVFLFALFSGEFKQVTENFVSENFAASSYCDVPQSKGMFGPWGSSQYTNVGQTAVARGSQQICTANTKLGFQTSKCGSSEFPTGVSTKRNMTTSVSPRVNPIGVPRMVRYSGSPADKMANNNLNPLDMVKAASSKPAMQAKPVVEKFDYEKAQIPLPQDMCNVNIMDSESQPVIYDRLMYSNMRSRLRGQGDYIRGDVKITPDNYKDGCQHNNWFQVSVKPERDLNPGAMEHLFGRSEELSLGVAQGDLCVPTYGI